MPVNRQPKTPDEGAITPETKFFGIGFNKTGTSTLGDCFRDLGIGPLYLDSQGSGWLTACILRGHFYWPAVRAARRFRGFEDRPWNVWRAYEKLDRAYPDSRFILTVRDPEAWWRSVERWLERKPRMRGVYRRHLRVRRLEKQASVAAFNGYNEAVRAYFGGSRRLLVIDVTKGAGWHDLCPFLGVQSPDLPFPHSNAQDYANST